jgi:hypothetical protein
MRGQRIEETLTLKQYLRHFFVGWVEARNPRNALGFASLNPTYMNRFLGLAKVLLKPNEKKLSKPRKTLN